MIEVAPVTQPANINQSWSSMSEYRTGKQIVEQYEIFPFEFVNRFIRKGLYPHAPHGGMITDVKSFLEDAFSLERLQAAADPKLVKIRDYVQDQQGKEWEEFELSDDGEINRTIEELLLTYLYRKDLYEVIQAQDQTYLYGNKPQAAKAVEEAPKAVRPSAIHKKICQRRAEKIWEIYPNMHPSELITYPSFRRDIKKKNGDDYLDDRLKKWVKEVQPVESKYSGPPKYLNIPAETIEVLMREVD